MRSPSTTTRELPPACHNWRKAETTMKTQHNQNEWVNEFLKKITLAMLSRTSCRDRDWRQRARQKTEHWTWCEMEEEAWVRLGAQDRGEWKRGSPAWQQAQSSVYRLLCSYKKGGGMKRKIYRFFLSLYWTCYGFFIFILMFWFPDHTSYGILAPWPGIELIRPALEGEVLTTGPAG